jgi:hypothetical protein
VRTPVLLILLVEGDNALHGHDCILMLHFTNSIDSFFSPVAKERAKADKLRKFQEKQQKLNTAPAVKAKEKKPKAEVEVIPEYIEETPKGQKKILKSLDDVHRKAYIPKVSYGNPRGCELIESLQKSLEYLLA